MHADAALVGLSQEHGTLEVSPALFDRIQLGDWIAVSPVHACLTANLYREYRTCDGRRLTRLTSLDEME
jgi:D-serine deaminase-like pyridoxal phosphate-dependent protein